MKAFRVFFTGPAEREAMQVRAWWREHRAAAPGLFEEELSSALATLAALPLAGSPYPNPRMNEVRRYLLRATRYHAYYRIESESVIILSVWSAVRGSRPDRFR
jgi:plasmid stabilization system protein ParE